MHTTVQDRRGIRQVAGLKSKTIPSPMFSKEGI